MQLIYFLDTQVAPSVIEAMRDESYIEMKEFDFSNLRSRIDHADGTKEKKLNI